MQLSPDSIRSSARQVIASAQSLIVSGSEVAAGYDKNEVHDTRMSRPTLQNSSARNALLKLSTGKGKISTPNNDSFIGVRVLTKNDANDRTMLSIRFDMTNKIIYNDKRLDFIAIRHDHYFHFPTVFSNASPCAMIRLTNLCRNSKSFFSSLRAR